MLNVQSLTQRTFAQIVVFALLLLNSTLAFAQNQVNGIVTDKTGEPLIGVNVGTFIKYYKISQLIHTQSIAN